MPQTPKKPNLHQPIEALPRPRLKESFKTHVLQRRAPTTKVSLCLSQGSPNEERLWGIYNRRRVTAERIQVWRPAWKLHLQGDPRLLGNENTYLDVIEMVTFRLRCLEIGLVRGLVHLTAIDERLQTRVHENLSGTALQQVGAAHRVVVVRRQLATLFLRSSRSHQLG